MLMWSILGGRVRRRQSFAGRLEFEFEFEILRFEFDLPAREK
jgi:hypothetical protein